MLKHTLHCNRSTILMAGQGTALDPYFIIGRPQSLESASPYIQLNAVHTEPNSSPSHTTHRAYLLYTSTFRKDGMSDK